MEKINQQELKIPTHLAIILDGNGRWAKKRGMPRTYGHAKGIEALVKISEACREIGIKSALVYAFSTENWSRPSDEVEFLMKALIENLGKYKERLLKNKTRVVILGERSNLPANILAAIEEVENLTKELYKSLASGIVKHTKNTCQSRISKTHKKITEI